MTSLKLAPLAAALALLAATPALAQNAQEKAVFRQQCSGDYVRFCGNYDPDSPQVEQCFQQNMRQLSPGCQQAIAAFNKASPQGRRR